MLIPPGSSSCRRKKNCRCARITGRFAIKVNDAVLGSELPSTDLWVADKHSTELAQRTRVDGFRGTRHFPSRVGLGVTPGQIAPPPGRWKILRAVHAFFFFLPYGAAIDLMNSCWGRNICVLRLSPTTEMHWSSSIGLVGLTGRSYFRHEWDERSLSNARNSARMATANGLPG